MLKIPYGESHFESLRTQGYLYVDKTRFIEEVEKTRRFLHLRPRRFGKSLFLSMMDCYYDVAMADRFDELFGGLHVHEFPTENRNSYYMLRFNFSGVQNTKLENLEQGFVAKVKDGAQAFIDRYDFDIKLVESNSAAIILGSLLSSFAALKLPNKVYMLIDEYDHFTNSVLSGDGEEFLTVLRRGGFVRAFYEVIKEKSELGIVERLFITGVMSVSLDSMTSGFNIAKNMTTNARYADVVGFTSEEVKDVLKKIGLSEEAQESTYEVFRENYNGYLFSEESDVRIFNSTLINYYLSEWQDNGNPPKSLVDVNLNQSGTTIGNIVDLKNREANYELIGQIVEDKEVIGELQPFINIDKKFDEDDVITMLYNIGILTIQNIEGRIRFVMPNKIIERICYKYLSDLTQKKADYQVNGRKRTVALRVLEETGDIEPITKLAEEFLTHISNRNLRKFDEKYVKLVYFMFLASTDQLLVYNEFPARNGFIDLLIKKSPGSNAKYGSIIEFKYIKKSDTTDAKIESELVEGIAQIEEYSKDERISKIPNLKKYVIVFSGYEVVKLQEL